jgi:hypothetical protein
LAAALVAAGSAFVAVGSAETTAADKAGARKCVKKWNAPSNSAAQQKLLNTYSQGQSGAIIVGSHKGTCVLASRQDGKNRFLIFKQDGNAFRKQPSRPSSEFNDYFATINGISVYLGASGTVDPV